ncbi:MAG: serine hydroxymethyltransferase [Clostridiales bacterium]|jgi:glycine hydroxymethyltransferase|nr:serine hydroxymethyltransferase [Clostridiales bacterium]
MLNYSTIQKADPELFEMMMKELRRQQGNIELIASENFVSEAVLSAAGSHLTNKYAEGYPGRRYYGGCEFVDEVENLAIARAKKLFGAEHANVQPHCGSSANMAAYRALIKHGDTVLALSLANGGHLTHGASVSFSGQDYKIVSYGVARDAETIDYDELQAAALRERPALLLAGASAYPRKLDFKRMKAIADSVGAFFMVDMAHIAGLVAAGLHESPVPYADIVTTTTHKTLRGPRSGLILCKEKHAKAVDKVVFPGIQGGPLLHIIAAKAAAFKEALAPEFKTYQRQIVANAAAMAGAFVRQGMKLVSGGTDTHLMLLNVAVCGTTGKETEILLDKANITLNKNTIPFETLAPSVASGIRIGTPSVTTRGMKEKEMETIADLIARVIREKDAAVPNVKKEVAALCEAYPLYEGS